MLTLFLYFDTQKGAANTRQGETQQSAMCLEAPVCSVLYLSTYIHTFEYYSTSSMLTLFYYFDKQKGAAKTRQGNDREGNESYVVEKIIKMKKSQGKNYYLVKWAGYPPSDNSWEPEENLNGAACEHCKSR